MVLLLFLGQKIVFFFILVNFKLYYFKNKIYIIPIRPLLIHGTGDSQRIGGPFLQLLVGTVVDLIMKDHYQKKIKLNSISLRHPPVGSGEAECFNTSGD